MIDLHLHTTASDGRYTPAELVASAAAAGLTVMAVTDHDTTASVAEVRTLAAARGIDAIAGIEVTAIEAGRDLHVLGYFFDPRHEGLGAFLAEQRRARIARVEATGERLATLGMPIDLGPLLEDARRQTGRSVGRPQIARAMIAAGHVADTREAFDRWLGSGCPAFIPRPGPPPEAVIAILHAAGGAVSLAHPGLDAVSAARIGALAAAGLDALEVYHPDHDATLVDQYLRIARDLDLSVTGGSDFHGDPAHGVHPGSVTLPAEEWRRLRERHSS